ncbi:MAG: hypothetical protein IJQ47_00220 [Synergistaceae bacterium]|nr:hypothetical protein [Synergistaceae bacterium]
MKIKTKEALHNIKTKSSSVVSKANSETQTGSSENEYSSVKLQNAEKETLRRGFYSAERFSRWGVRKIRQNIAKKKKAAGQTAKASKRAAQTAKKAAEKTTQLVKAAVKATIQAVKAAIAGIKSLVAAIAAGGSTAVVVIVMICTVGFVAGSVFAIFLPNDNNSEYTIQKAMYDIEHEYNRRKSELAESISHDVLIYEGEMSEWKDVISVYAVKLNLSTDDPQEIATSDEKKAEQLKEIFFDMNELTTKTEIQSYTVTVTKTDDDGNEIEVEETRYITYLTVISVPKTAYEAANIYGFSEKQMKALDELLNQDNEILWDGLLK